MDDYEKLGVFYLGEEYDFQKKERVGEPVLLKSKDLTTHGVIIGMTGSGKTGLGVGIIEEAAIDNIPVLVIDPKGDMGNLALTFPGLSSEEFQPWVNAYEAESKGKTIEEYAKEQSELWKNGLSQWGQDGSRIKKLRDAAEVRVFTPGSSAGIQVSILQSFQAPSEELKKDPDAYRDRISITATSLLSLINIEVDPFNSREFILLSNILEKAWDEGKSPGIEELISWIQNPPMEKVGVMDIENFFPSKERFALTMMFNNLIASPSYQAWMEGEALDINKFMYNENGKPRISVFSISHLTDGERMFFVTMLLNEILAWTRMQSGTSSLRALLYMDELFGYLPPTANPPSKAPLLTLLKQARAYGLGLILSTQNPVDLDYKALSNAGTWFIGRLQTERDKERVLAGLEGAAEGKFNRKKAEQILSGLGQRVFYLHSVHEDEPVIFNTRWTLSYLAGPLNKSQISSLSQNQQISEPEKNLSSVKMGSTSIPVLSPKIRQVYFPEKPETKNTYYLPYVVGVAEVHYSSSKYGVAASKNYILLAQAPKGPIGFDWKQGNLVDLDPKEILDVPVDKAEYAEYPESISLEENYEKWQRLLNQYIRTELSLKLFYSSVLKKISEVGEEERDFRIRLQHMAHEGRDEALEEIKVKYSSKIQKLEEKIRKAEQSVEKQSTMANQKKIDAAVSAGTAIFGAIFGRKKINVTSVSRMGTAVRNTSKAMKSGQSIDNAKETLESLQLQMKELQEELQGRLEEVSEGFDMQEEKLEEISVRATSGNITIHLTGLAWVPDTFEL